MERQVGKMREATVDHSRRTILVFSMDEQRYGLVASTVQELLPVCSVTSLPKAPAIVEGAVNVRGRVVPVFNVRQRFGLRPATASPTEHFIVAVAGSRIVALRVDRALDLVDVETSSIAETAELSGTLAHVAGVVPLVDGLLLIHDLETFLTRAEAEALDAALQEADVAEAGEGWTD